MIEFLVEEGFPGGSILFLLKNGIFEVEDLERVPNLIIYEKAISIITPPDAVRNRVN